MTSDNYILPQLYGLDKLKQAIHYLLLMQEENAQDQLSIAVIAEPGCGKTEIARWLAKQSSAVSVVDDFDMDFFELEELANVALFTRPYHDYIEGEKIRTEEIPLPRGI